MTTLVLRGDARSLPLADSSVDCVVTSPPYYRQRDYEDDAGSLEGQVGQEQTPAEYLTVLLDVLAEVRRVLRPDGTVWWNMGDAYSGRANGGPSVGRSGRGDRADVIPHRVNTTAMAPYKSLLMLPERFAIAAADAGWVIRNRIVWWKRNGMRHPVTDRLVALHEPVFLLAPAPHYRFDLDAIREPGAEPAKPAALASAKYGDDRRERPGRRGHGGGSPERNTHPLGRNPGDVWDIPTTPNASEHYAPYPFELARRCILAGSPADGVVLDPFGGSGSTALVADVLGRHAISVDLSAKYSRIARQRIADPVERARAAQLPRPEPVPEGQHDIFAELASLEGAA